jgi:hypothetical protein
MFPYSIQIFIFLFNIRTVQKVVTAAWEQLDEADVGE